MGSYPEMYIMIPDGLRVNPCLSSVILVCLFIFLLFCLSCTILWDRHLVLVVNALEREAVNPHESPSFCNKKIIVDPSPSLLHHCSPNISFTNLSKSSIMCYSHNYCEGFKMQGLVQFFSMWPPLLQVQTSISMCGLKILF